MGRERAARCHFENSFSVSGVTRHTGPQAAAMLTDLAEGSSQGRRHGCCSAQDHPESSTQGGGACQKRSRATVAVMVLSSGEIGPTTAPGLQRLKPRNSPAQARWQSTQLTQAHDFLTIYVIHSLAGF